MKHLKKRVKISVVVVLSAVVVIIIAVGAIHFTSRYLDNQYAKLHEGCKPNQPNHLVVIQNDNAVPDNIVASRCETLTIKNLDNEDRMIAFGLHEDHVPYDGVSEQLMSLGQSLTVTLVQTGNFRFHDHVHDEVQATFEVK